MKATSPQTARAAERQPSNFDGLSTSVTAVDELAVSRLLACQCGSTVGRVEACKGDSDFPYGDPLTFACRACGRSCTFFDSNRDGYDGRLGHGSSYERGSVKADVTCPQCGGAELTVRCDLIYNIEPSELEEDLGSEAKEKLSDYFDALAVNAECTSCSRAFNVGNWELA